MAFQYNPNMYTADLDKFLVEEAIIHAKEEFPNECCGAILNDGAYVRFKNEADDISQEFEVKDDLWFDLYTQDEVACLVHSHNDFNKASVLDQQQQKALDIPSLIINLRHRSVLDVIVFGCEEHAPLHGRPFFYGVFDCISLVDDYIFEQYGVHTTYPETEYGFWGQSKNMFEVGFDGDLPFYQVPIDEMKKNDILLYNMGGTRFISHIAALVSDRGEVLHHIEHHLSGTYPITFNRKYLRQVMRYKE